MKILDALPKSWRSKALAIKESKDLKTFLIEELMGSVLTHTMKLKRLNEIEGTTIKLGNECLMAKKIRKNIMQEQRENKWFLDSGCSRHMTRNLSQIDNLKQIDEGFVNFADKKRMNPCYWKY